MLTQDRITEIFQKTGVLQEGHFVLASGRHSGRYMQCARIFEYPAYAGELCRALAEGFRESRVDVVIGPALGAVQMAYEVSRHLNCRNIFAERVEGAMALRRTFAIKPGERVLVVEDAVTTGGSVKEVLELVRKAGGIPVGVGAIVDRSMGRADFGTEFHSVSRLDIESWPPEECPLCRDGVPVSRPGTKQQQKK